MNEHAIILTDGLLHQPYAKTAHGLIIGQSRYPIVAVIDSFSAGKDAGTVIDKKPRGIPTFATVEDALSNLECKPTRCIIGVATPGGHFTSTLLESIKDAIKNQLCIVNGLHQLIADHEELKPLLKKYQAKIIDIRAPKKFHELHHWEGKIRNVKTPRIAVLGMDCGIGKRTTAQMLYSQCKQSNIKAEMIYTGQTGYLQGFHYGFILDSTINDFVSGELEHAIVSCVNEVKPELILIEGQSSLRNPSGPCGAEFICSGGAKGVILQYPVGRDYFDLGDEVKYSFPDLSDEISLIEHYGAKVIAVTLNTSSLRKETWDHAKKRIEAEVNRSVICPREEGVETLMPMIKEFIAQESGSCS